MSISALKLSEDGEAIILRLYNPTEKRVRGTIDCARRIVAAEAITLEEKPEKTLKPKGTSLNLQVGPKKIVTLRLKLA